MYLTVRLLGSPAPSSIPNYGGVFQGIFPWLITFSAYAWVWEDQRLGPQLKQ